MPDEENISPSLDEDDLEKPINLGASGKAKKPGPKEKAVQAAGDKGKDLGKKAIKGAAKKAAAAIARYAASAASAAAAAVGWPVLAGCLAIFLIILLIFGGLACVSLSGHFGKTFPQSAGKNDANVVALVAATKVKAKNNTHKLDFKNQRDFEYLESGKIDRRLAAALNYLVQRHEHISISHIVSGYEDMKLDPESGTFHDSQITKNISAHKEGLAADIDEIDYVTISKKDVPIKVSWQAIGEKTAAIPDVLNKITGAADLAQSDIKKALEELGVKGLDQPDIVEKLKGVNGIASAFDLTKPEVISQLANIGVTGVDNAALQDGLKRTQALQGIYDLSPQDLNALTTGDNADLLGQIGIQINADTRASIEKYQQTQVLQSINSASDLDRSDIQDSLRALNIDPNDANFRASLDKMLAAKTIISWQGDFTDPKLQQELAKFGLANSADLQKALNLWRSQKNGLTSAAGSILVDATTLAELNKMNINIEDIAGQEVYNTIRAAAQISDWKNSLSDALWQSAAAQLKFEVTPQNQEIFDKFQAAQYIKNYRGTLDDPQLQASLQKFNLGTDKLGEFQQADTMTNLAKYANLQTLFPEEYGILKGAQELLNTSTVKDLQKEVGQQALNQFAINNPALYEEIAGLVNLTKVLNGQTLKDFGNAALKEAVAGINLGDFSGELGQIAAINTIANIHNVNDLTKPEVQQALSEFNINTGDLGATLGQAADINALASIRSPQDFLKPSVIKAMGNLNIIQVTPQLMGQIGALQGLLQMNSIADLFNPQMILNLNTLGLISLSNPVIAALTAITMISQFLGINLFGGGGCTSQKCLKEAAQKKVHTVIEQLLQFPYDMNSPNYYRVTQLITYSAERDVTPFADKLDALYGSSHPSNYGLFAMPEARDHLHIGY